MDKRLYVKRPGARSRWVSFENPQGLPGRAGIENGGAKGRAFEPLEAGETKTLMDIDGQGIVHCIWLTVSDRAPETLRALTLNMYWDGAESPAVSAPLGDFFCHPLGIMTVLENALFSSPEGRSFNSFADMPFLRHARITLSNNSGQRLNHLFYAIHYTLEPLNAEETLYFHCVFGRENPTVRGRDYTVLPKVRGAGAFIGMNVGVNVNPAYGKTWFGEGEVKVYLDGDDAYPTLCGTGTEDYIGTAWGQGRFINRFGGCTVADGQRFGFYRLHINDAIVFHKDIAVALQVIGGADKYDLLRAAGTGAAFTVTSRDTAGKPFAHLAGVPFELTGQSENGFYNFYRSDDFSSTAYFYLDRAGM